MANLPGAGKGRTTVDFTRLASTIKPGQCECPYHNCENNTRAKHSSLCKGCQNFSCQDEVEASSESNPLAPFHCRCGELNNPGARWCSGCGEEIPAPKQKAS